MDCLGWDKVAPTVVQVRLGGGRTRAVTVTERSGWSRVFQIEQPDVVTKAQERGWTASLWICPLATGLTTGKPLSGAEPVSQPEHEQTTPCVLYKNQIR